MRVEDFLTQSQWQNDRIRARTVCTSELSPFISEYRGSQKIRCSAIYIISCDLCYDVTFYNSSMPWKPVCSVKTLFLCEHLVRKTQTGIDWCMPYGCIVCDMYGHISQRNYYISPWPIPYVQLSSPRLLQELHTHVLPSWSPHHPLARYYP